MLAVCVAVFATVAVGNQDESDALLSTRVTVKHLPETHGATVETETHSYIPDSELLPKIKEVLDSELEEVLDSVLEPKIREVLGTMTDEFKGETGDTGDSGVNGTHGNHGNDGEKGEKGDSGVNGNHGTDGQDGAQGDQGDQGDDGVDGEKGETGESGVNGNHGTDGQNGAKGDKGDQGNDGVKGDKGDSAPAPWWCVVRGRTSRVSGPFFHIHSAISELNSQRAHSGNPQMICQMTAAGVQSDPHIVGGKHQGGGPSSGFQKWWSGWDHIHRMSRICVANSACKNGAR